MVGPRVVVVGGGAAGFFAALRAAELGARVVILEAGSEPLAKVRISGGGRCNVTQANFDVGRLIENYPRGARELRAAFARFQPRDTMRWFEENGVALKVEPDGRAFPTTDDSQTVIDCFLRLADERGIELRTRVKPQRIERLADGGGNGDADDGGGWRVSLPHGETLDADRVLLATGSNPQGLALARMAGHAVVDPVPALFSFVVRDPRIQGLAGVAVPHVHATLAVEGLKKPISKEGPLLVTHQGLSAHAILRLSSFAAPELAAAGYRARLTLDLAPSTSDETLRAGADAARAAHPRGTLGAHPFVDTIPRRLWDRLLLAADLDPQMQWSQAPKKGLQALLDEIKRGRYEVSGKGEFREEIVTAGGVPRKEVDWTRMESRLAKGLHLAGEILDVDGLTGGYNFQNAWTTAWIAGTAMGEKQE